MQEKFKQEIQIQKLYEQKLGFFSNQITSSAVNVYISHSVERRAIFWSNVHTFWSLISLCEFCLDTSKQDRLGANCRFSTFGIGRWSLRMTTRGVLCTFLGAAAAVAAVKRSDREIYHLFDLFVSSLTLLPMLYARLVCFKQFGQNLF